MESLTNVVEIINKGKDHCSKPGGIWQSLGRHEDGNVMIARKDTPKPDPHITIDKTLTGKGSLACPSGAMMTWDELTKKDE